MRMLNDVLANTLCVTYFTKEVLKRSQIKNWQPEDG